MRDVRPLNIFALFKDSFKVMNLLYDLRRVKDISEIYFHKEIILPYFITGGGTLHHTLPSLKFLEVWYGLSESAVRISCLPFLVSSDMKKTYSWCWKSSLFSFNFFIVSSYCLKLIRILLNNFAAFFLLLFPTNLISHVICLGLIFYPGI